MKGKKNNHVKIFEALKAIHQTPRIKEEGKVWKQDLMRKIRMGDLDFYQKEVGFPVDVLVWRISLAIFSIALILGIFTAMSGILPESEIASLFLQDIEGKFLYQPLASLAFP